MAEIMLRPLAQVATAPGQETQSVARRGGATLDRRAFLQRVDRWQARFEALPGGRVALFVADAFEFAAALYGAWHAGKTVYVPGDALPATVQRLRTDVDHLAGDFDDGVQAATEWAPMQRQPLDPLQTRLVLFTSGSSGEPVAIEKRLAQLQAEIDVQHALFGVHWAAHEGLRVHATVSHHHIYGLLFVLLWPLAAGQTFVVERLTYAEEIAAQTAQSPSLLVASPAHLKRLPPDIDWRGAQRCMVAVLSSGGPLPADAATQAAQCFGCSPIEIFGSSETGGIAWRQRASDGEAWRALPGVQWRIDDDGLLQVRSPHLADDAWWTTADLAQALPDGRFLLRGRADRIAKIEEKRVSLSAIERALLDTPWVAQARVLVLDAGGAQRVGAVVVPTAAGRQLAAMEGSRGLHQRLKQALASRVESVALPRRWREVDALPLNTQGKTTEAALRALFLREDVPAVQWASAGAGRVEGQFSVPADHLAFDGHFPEVPILPGVVQLQWAVHWGRDRFGIVGAVTRVEALKFQQVVRPEMPVNATLDWVPDKRALSFRYTSASGSHASGRIVFKA